MSLNNSTPWMTIVVCLMAVVIVAVGGVVVVLGNMTFQEYLDSLEKFAIGVGLLGVGRGIASHKAAAPTTVVNNLATEPPTTP